jgi:penicillin-insensitive murein endopeptidase
MKSILTSIALLLLIVQIPLYSNAESICYGTTQKGRLENGEKLPKSGNNFSSYSEIGWAAGRTFVHSKVKEILLVAYQNLEMSAPGKVFVYAETGWEKGGSFKPHKTHQNGLSTDLMVPIVESKIGKSVPMPTNNVLNKWGYSIEFNSKGIYKEYAIDFEALGELIYHIHAAAAHRQVKMWRVIFDPAMITLLHASKRGAFIKQNIMIPTKKSWVRHDEHIHIDFDIPCKPLYHKDLRLC